MRPNLTSGFVLLGTLILVMLGSGSADVRAQPLELQWEATLPSGTILSAANGSRYAVIQSDTGTMKRVIIYRGTDLEVIDTVMIDQNSIPPELGGTVNFAFADSVLCSLVLKDDDSLYVVTYDEASRQLDTLDAPVSLRLFSRNPDMEIKLDLMSEHTSGYLLIAISEKGLTSSYGDYHESGMIQAYHISTGNNLTVSYGYMSHQVSYSSNRSRYITHDRYFFRSGDSKTFVDRNDHELRDGVSQGRIESLSDSLDYRRLNDATVFDSSGIIVSGCLRYEGPHTWGTIPHLDCGRWSSLYGRSHLVGLRKETDSTTQLVVADLATQTTQVVDSWEDEGTSYISQLHSDYRVLTVINYTRGYARRYAYSPSIGIDDRDTIHVNMADTIALHEEATLKLTAYSRDPLRIDSIRSDGWNSTGFRPITGKLPAVPVNYTFTAARAGTHDVFVYATSEKDSSRRLLTRRSVYIAPQPGSVFSVKVPYTLQNLHVIDGVLFVSDVSSVWSQVSCASDSVSALVKNGIFTDDAGYRFQTHVIVGVVGDTMWLAQNTGDSEGWGLVIKKFTTSGDSIGIVGYVNGIYRYHDDDVYEWAYPLTYRFQLARIRTSENVLISIEPIWGRRVRGIPVSGALYEFGPGVDTLFEKDQSRLNRSIDARPGKGIIFSGRQSSNQDAAFSYDTLAGDRTVLFYTPQGTTIKDAIYVTDSLVMTTSGLHRLNRDGQWTEQLRFTFRDGNDIVPLTDRYSAVIRRQSDTVAVVVDHYTGEVLASVGSIYGKAYIGAYSPDDRILIVASDEAVLAGYDVSNVVSVPGSMQSSRPEVRARYQDGQIEITAPVTISAAELYDLSGGRVAAESFNDGQVDATLSVGDVPSGVYVLRVACGESLSSVIVQIVR